MSILDEDIAPDQRLSVTNAETVDSVRPVAIPASIYMSRRRRLRRARARSFPKVPLTSPSAQIESVHVVKMTSVGPRHRTLPLACQPRDASIVTRLPELAWGDLLRALKGGRDTTTMSSLPILGVQ